MREGERREDGGEKERKIEREKERKRERERARGVEWKSIKQ